MNRITPPEDVARVRELQALDDLQTSYGRFFPTFLVDCDWAGVRLDLTVSAERPRELANKLRDIAERVEACQR